MSEQPPRPGRALQLACVLVVAGGVALWLRGVVSRGPTDFDDAYMFLRYAAHLFSGEGLRWNLGEPPVQGVTSLPHLLVVTALLAGLPAGLEQGRLLQIASGAAALAGIAVLARAVARTSPHRWLQANTLVCAALLVPTLMFSDAFTFHSWSGMDTMLAFLANGGLCLAVLGAVANVTPRRLLLLLAVAYLAWLVRPDNLGFALLVPALALALLPALPRARRLRIAAGFVGTLVLLVIVDLLARRLLLGSALPLSFYAKLPGAYRAYGGETGWNTPLFLRVFLAGALPFVLAMTFLARRAHARQLAVFLLPVAMTCGALFFVNHVMGHLGRFFFPALPFVVVAAAGLPLRPPGRWPWRLAGALALVVVGNAALLAAAARFDEDGATPPSARFETPALSPLPALDSWAAAAAIAQLAAEAPPGTRLAMSEHGLPGARAPAVTIIDVLGLHDPAFVRGFDVARLWARDPDFIWMPHPDHAGMLADVYGSAELWRRYEVYPEAFFYGLAVRKSDGTTRGEGHARLFRAAWSRSYPGVTPADHRAQPAPGRDSDNLPP